MANTEKFLNFLKILESNGTGKDLVRAASKEIAKPLAEIATNVLKGNFEEIDVKYIKPFKKILRDLYQLRNKKKDIRKYLLRHSPTVLKLLLYLRPQLLKKFG